MISAPLLDGPCRLEGAFDFEYTGPGLVPWRLPASARKYLDEMTRLTASMTSGVRLAVRTSSSIIELDVHVVQVAFDVHHRREPAVFDLVIDGETVVSQPALAATWKTLDVRPGESVTAKVAGDAWRVDEGRLSPFASRVCRRTTSTASSGCRRMPRWSCERFASTAVP